MLPRPIHRAACLLAAAAGLVTLAAFGRAVEPTTQPIRIRVHPQPQVIVPSAVVSQDLDQNIIPSPDKVPPVSQHIDVTQTLPSRTVPALVEQVAKLGSANTDDRDRARQLLMSLSTEDLPNLREAVKESARLSPTQISLLRDVVCHVCVAPARSATQPDGATGFLGVLFDGSYPPSLSAGAVVRDRIPGFIANRALCDGDLIDWIQVYASEQTPVFDKGDLPNLVGNLPPGTAITLGVLRGGRQISVTLALDARPAILNPRGSLADQDAFIEARNAEAQTYWNTVFAPIVGDVEPTDTPITPLSSAAIPQR